MDIEHLSKSQIILLTLFVSFVTSIATGIVTYSLMQQAPPPITQTVNRIVERTIEKAVPGHVAALAATPVKTVVVKESESIASAVKTMTPSVVRVYTDDANNAKFLGMGVVLTADGLVATDALIVGTLQGAIAVLHDDTRVRMIVAKRDTASGIALLTATTSPNEKVPEWKPAGVADAQASLGQSVVALSGRATLRLGVGVISSIEHLSSAPNMPIFETSIDESAIVPGAPLIDGSGTLVGISTSISRSVDPSAFIPNQALLSKSELVTGQP